MELLLFLVEQRGQLVTREQIVERVWVRTFFSIPITASMLRFERSAKLSRMIRNGRDLFTQ